jgi:outer membrane protein
MQIYELALKNDPAFSSAFHENQAVQERLEQGKALFRPSVSLTGTTNRSETNIEYVGAGNVYRNNGRESFDSYGYSVNINQPVFRKQINAQYEQAKSQVRQADAQLVVARQDLIVRTSQAYFDVLFAQDTIDLIQARM